MAIVPERTRRDLGGVYRMNHMWKGWPTTRIFVAIAVCLLCFSLNNVADRVVGPSSNDPLAVAIGIGGWPDLKEASQALAFRGAPIRGNCVPANRELLPNWPTV